MLLVLIRHSIAEDISPAKEDHLRDLTPEGVRLFDSAIPGLVQFLHGQGRLEIWHSPAARTAQTAQILRKHIPESVLRPMDCIAHSNFESFSGILKTSELPEVLLVVGHEPGMSVWSRRIAGVDLTFPKGACAGFRLKDKTRLKGKLEFFLHPSALQRLQGGTRG